MCDRRLDQLHVWRARRQPELAIAQCQPNVVAEAEAWFDALWDEAEDDGDRLIEIVTAREADTLDATRCRPAGCSNHRDELGCSPRTRTRRSPPGQPGGVTLVDFQRHGYRRRLRILERFDGVLIGDGIGLGKSFIG